MRKLKLLMAACALMIGSVNANAQTDVTASYVGDVTWIVNGGGHSHEAENDNHKEANGIGWWNTQSLPSGWHAFAAPNSSGGAGESWTPGFGSAGVMMGRTMVLPEGNYTLSFEACGMNATNSSDAAATPAPGDAVAFLTGKEDVDITNSTPGDNTFHTVSFTFDVTTANTAYEFGIKKVTNDSKIDWCQIKNVKLMLNSTNIYPIANNSIDAFTYSLASEENKDTWHTNTWSTEGQSDGTRFQVPFHELWKGSGGKLLDATITGTYTPTANGVYKVSAWVRAANEAGGDVTGLKIFVGDAETDACTGISVMGGKGRLGTYTAMADGVAGTPFNYGFNINNATINWLAFKNVTITYYAEVPEAEKNALLALVPTGTMSTLAQEQLNTCKTAFESNASVANYNALSAAISAANASIAEYAIIDAGTIPTDATTGWAKSTTNGDLACNTWSKEGNSDGSGMTTPFIQDWIGSGTPLAGGNAGGKLYYTFNNLTPGETYVVTARVRVFNESGSGVTGASYYVGENSKSFETFGEVCAGDFASKGKFAVLSCLGTVDSDGKLEFGVVLDAASPINWIAIKDVTIAESTGIVPTAIGLDETAVTLTTGGFTKLSATVSPSNADDKTILWTSSEPTVATVSGGTVVALKAGTAIITATAYAGTDVKTTCTVTVADAPAITNFSEVAEGDFYIRNVATGMFLGGANSWGAQASIIKHGIPIGLTKVNDGVYTLDTYTYNNGSHFFNGTYVDGASTDIYVTSLGSGTYALSTADGSAFVTVNAGGTTVSNIAANSNSTLAQWQFVSASDKLKDLTASTVENPGDATFYLQEANISRNMRKSSGQSAWKGTFTYGGNNENQCAESINKTHDVYQTASVPNGTYIVKAQGFYRPGKSAVASYLYANDQQVALKLYNAETLPSESMAGASTAFSADRFWNQVEVTVTDNKLTIGIKTDATDSWTIWDNFELYLKNTTGLNVTPTIADGDYYLTPDAGLTYISRGQNSKETNEASISADGELLATVRTDIAGISTITYKDTNRRLFWNEEKVYTDGKLHVEKNYHHHFWAIEKDGDNYKLRNIETGLYLKVQDGAATVAAAGNNWKFDVESSDYTAMNSAITTAEANTLGFEIGEYAPYNNVDAIKALAAAKAFDKTGTKPALKIANVTTALTSATWTANTTEENAIYWKTDYTADDKAADNYVHPIGWTNTGYNTRIMCAANDAASNPAMTTIGTAVFSKFNTTYGETVGYTMPLKAGKIYKITFKYCGWGNTPTTNVVLTDPESNIITLAPGFRPSTSDGNTNAEHWYNYTGYFVSTTAGNYVLAMNKVETGQQQIAWADMQLVSASELEFADGSVPTYAPGTYPAVKITRTLTADKWATAVYPFVVSGVDKIAVLDSYNKSTGALGFKSATTSVANEPFLMRSNSNKSEIELSNVAVAAASVIDAKADEASLKGTYEAIDITNAEKNYVLSNNTIYPVGTAGATINPYRAYIQLAQPTESRLSFFVDDEEVTGIEGIQMEKVAKGTVYNLNGQRVEKAKKGLYIKNGKKVVVK